MKKTHTAEKYILDGKICSHDLVYVSSTKFKNGTISNVLRDYYLKLFNQHPPHLLQEQSLIPDTQ